MAQIFCMDCGLELAWTDVACTVCGSHNRSIHVTDEASAVESMNVKGRHGSPGEVRPYLRTTVKREWSPDRGAWEEVTRVFDSDAGIYEATYRSLETRAVTFHKRGRLDDQGLHGPRGNDRPRPPSRR
jgi:hypothetical protein